MFGVSPLLPAYGRDYKSAKEAQADFDADKDFATPAGQYINKSQVKDLGMKTINVRFKRQTQVGVLKVR